MPTRIVHIQSPDDLGATARRVFDTLSVEEYAERDSENYPGGTYYLGALGELRIKVAEESDDGWEDFQYWVVLSTPASPALAIDDALDALLVELLGVGFGAGRELGAKGTTMEREIYSLDGDGHLRAKREPRPLPQQT